MNPRKTTTGAVLENMVLPALQNGGYTCQKQIMVGNRPHGKKHVIDVLAIDKSEKKYLISLKWQQSSGTAEQKVPFEVMSLMDAMQTGEFEKAYLVLGGIGWTIRDFYIGGGLDKYLTNSQQIKIIDLENFIALANKGKL
jgi:hypothetical protein